VPTVPDTAPAGTLPQVNRIQTLNTGIRVQCSVVLSVVVCAAAAVARLLQAVMKESEGVYKCVWAVEASSVAAVRALPRRRWSYVVVL
jgi:hypothetical protein